MTFRSFHAGLVLRRTIPIGLIVLGICRIAVLALGSPPQTIIKRTDVQFTVCNQSTTWTRPTPEQQAKIWNDPRYAGYDLQKSYKWTHEFLLVSADSASLQYDAKNEAGLWMEDTSGCDEPQYKRQGEWIRAWILLHRVQSIVAADGVYTIRVEPTAKGFQSIVFKRLGPNISVRFVDPQGRLLEEMKN